MIGKAQTSSLLALIAVLALTMPTAAAEDHGHAHGAAAHDEDHAHDDDHAHEEDHGHEEDAAHAFETAGVKIVHPWMNATSGREALIFLELENIGNGSVSLEGAEVPFAETATLVGFALENGEGRYRDLPFVPVSPGRTLDLAPEGLAILASGLTRDFTEGQTVEITLQTSAGKIPLIVAVESETARQHSHAGHNH